MPRRNRNAAYKRPRANAGAFYVTEGKVGASDIKDAPEAVETAKLKASALEAYFAAEQPSYIVDDARIGKKLGVSADVVRAHRRLHGIPSFVTRMKNAIADASRAIVSEKNYANYLNSRMERMEKAHRVDVRLSFWIGFVFGAIFLGLILSIALAFE